MQTTSSPDRKPGISHWRSSDHYVFYKWRGGVLAMTTCRCCRYGHYRDAIHMRKDGTVETLGMPSSAVKGKQPLSVEQAKEIAPEFMHRLTAPIEIFTKIETINNLAASTSQPI